ncbi:unnamed protein product, partial [Staurois parvus]
MQMCGLLGSGPRRRAAAHLRSIKKGHTCRECAPCPLPAHMCGAHGKVPVRSFDRDLSRSCDRPVTSRRPHDTKPRPVHLPAQELLFMPERSGVKGL